MTREQYMLSVIRQHIDERIKQHTDNLLGWCEPDGFLLPTEPDPAERECVRRELRAALFELNRIRDIVGEAQEIGP